MIFYQENMIFPSRSACFKKNKNRIELDCLMVRTLRLILNI